MSDKSAALSCLITALIVLAAGIFLLIFGALQSAA
jgi:hypothetical protein